MPQIRYFLSGGIPIGDADPVWRVSLPLHRAPVAGERPSLSHGEYFQLVQRYLQQDRWHRLTAAIRAQTGLATDAADLGRVGIHLEKHGQYGHPSRVTVDFADRGDELDRADWLDARLVK